MTSEQDFGAAATTTFNAEGSDKAIEMEEMKEGERVNPTAETASAKQLASEKDLEEYEQQQSSQEQGCLDQPKGKTTFAISNDENPYHASNDGFQQSLPTPFDSSAALRRGYLQGSPQRSPPSKSEIEYKQPSAAKPDLDDGSGKQQNHQLIHHDQPACPRHSGPAGYFGILCAPSALSGNHPTNGSDGLYDYIALPTYSDQFNAEDATSAQEEQESCENFSPLLPSHSDPVATWTSSPLPPPSEIDFSNFSHFGKHLRSSNFPRFFPSHLVQTTNSQSVQRPPRDGPKYHYRFGLEEPPWQPPLPPMRHRNDTTPLEVPVQGSPPNLVFEPVRKLAFLLFRREHGQSGYFGARHDAALFERSFAMEMATTEGEDELCGVEDDVPGGGGNEDDAARDTKDDEDEYVEDHADGD